MAEKIPIIGLPIIGLMAGTSVDGIDAAMLITDGITAKKTPHAITIPYADETRAAIFAQFNNMKKDKTAIDKHDHLAQLIARDHAAACIKVISISGKTPHLIGFHGQTVFHDPDNGVSLQLGDPHSLARRIGVPVVHSFRQKDMANGGQGAPLAPIYHQVLINKMRLDGAVAVVNIGGISNATLWPNLSNDNDNLSGFDTGPGNALMDDAMHAHDGSGVDIDGRMAAAGTPHHQLIDTILTQDYFKRIGAKSLDRMGLYGLISDAEYQGQRLDNLPIKDRLATLTMLTARSIIDGIRLNNNAVRHIIICGGGSLNPTLMRMIVSVAPHITITTMEDHGLDSRFIEAELMAFLAARSHYGLPITFPNTTGVSSPQSGGIMAYP